MSVITSIDDIFIGNEHSIPLNLDPTKLHTLLRKKENKHAAVQDICKEVTGFLLDNNVDSTEIFPQANLPFHMLDLGKVVLFIIDDYSKFNNKVLPKKYVENLHFEWRKNGYRVIWIKKFEWEDLRKRQVLQSLILHACGRTKNRVFARNTYAEIIPSIQLKEFFNKSSFYGFRNASFSACLRDKKTDEILMAISFGHPYYGKNKYGSDAVECIRAASKPFTIIVGGMSKLMKFILSEFGTTFQTIVYYVDDSHYNSGSMDALGFKFSHFAGGASHNVWIETGSMFMRTPALHKEIMYMIKQNEIAAIPDVGNSTFVFKTGNEIANASSTDT